METSNYISSEMILFIIIISFIIWISQQFPEKKKPGKYKCNKCGCPTNRDQPLCYDCNY